MKIKKPVKILIIIFSAIFIVLLSIAIFYFYNFCRFMDSLGECGFDAGPYYGKKINIDFKTFKYDEFIEVPNGKIFVSNEHDAMPLILLKTDKANNVIWAYEFVMEKEELIPFSSISNLQLVEGKKYKSINFFNNSYSEPGSIYLTDDYDFKYICLSPF